MDSGFFTQCKLISTKVKQKVILLLVVWEVLVHLGSFDMCNRGGCQRIWSGSYRREGEDHCSNDQANRNVGICVCCTYHVRARGFL